MCQLIMSPIVVIGNQITNLIEESLYLLRYQYTLLPRLSLEDVRLAWSKQIIAFNLVAFKNNVKVMH